MKELHTHIADLLMRSTGIDVSTYEISFLDTSLQKRMTETGYDSLEAYCAFLEQSDSERTTFIESVHISHSKFFRDPLSFTVLERIILPSIVLRSKNCGRNEIRIWSAACAGGQEAYSLAILLEELVKSDTQTFTYRIFATDQSEAQVNEAMKGQYAASALDSVSLKRAGEWFTREGDVYTVSAKLKKHIEFSTFDLLNEETGCPTASIFGDFNLVICANLLFYYKDQYRKAILKKIGNCLAPGGYLMTGETERDIVKKYNYQELFPQSAIFRD